MSTQVILNIYDLSNQNSWFYWCGVGVYHSGVEVHGVEYAYGGHEYDVSGIFATNPRDAPGPVLFRESVVVGETSLTPQQVQQAVQELGQEYKGNRYHLLQRNCNHFSDHLCVKLTGMHPPVWVNRLAGLAVMLHCLLPVAWVPPLVTPSAGPSVGTVPLHSEQRHEERQSLLASQQRTSSSTSTSSSRATTREQREHKQNQRPISVQ
jgi:hypothetical protein